MQGAGLNVILKVYRLHEETCGIQVEAQRCTIVSLDVIIVLV